MVEKSISGIVTWLGNWFQDKLVSGSNIKKISCNNTEYDLLSNPSTNLNFKTVNGNNLVGVGDISISGGGSSAIACVSDMGLDDTVPTDVELYLDACNGKVIDSISKSTSGLVDTYTITYDDNSTYVFTVTNGSDATVDIVTNTNGWNSTTSDSKVPSEKLVKNSLDSKSDSTHSHNSHISYGRVDSTSTSTVFTATVNGVTELVDGTTVMLRNGVVTSASGFTLNVNNLGAKPVYSSMHDATADTTIFNINYTMLFVYDSTRITGGCWICYRGYNSDNNTIGYQIRTNNSVFTTTDRGYRYRIWLETDDGKYMPVNTSTSTNATANRSSAMNTREFWLGGKIVYNSTKADYQANVTLPSNTMWQQYNFALGYSFNNTGSALTLTSGQPLYMVCTDEGGGKGKLASPYYTQTLPSTEDNKLYIYLGHMTSAVNMELALQHPIYEYKNGSIRLYRDTYTTSEVDTLLNGKSDTGHTHSGYANSTHTHTKSQITDFPNLSTVATSGSYNDLSNKPTIPTVPTNVSAFTNDSGYLTSHQSLTNYIQKSNTNGLIKNDGTIDTSSYLTTGTASSTYVAKESGKGLFSGSYNDLTNKPTIPTVPTNVSAFTNDSGYLTSHQDISNYVQKSNTTGLLKNDGTVDTSTYLTSHQSLANYVQKSSTTGLLKNDGTVDTSTYLTSHQSLTNYLQKSDVKNNLTSTDTDKPLSANQGKELKTLVDGKQATLVSGTTIKTINGESVLGSGNITISGGAISETIYEDDCSIDNTNDYGSSIALRNSGTSTLAYNSNGYYTITNTKSQAESFIPITGLTGITGDFTLEYDSYVEGSNGSSGLVIYNSATSWEKLTDDSDSNKKYWYGYNDGSFHESAFYGNIVTNQKWVHYKYTLQGSVFTMEVSYNGSTVVSHTESIHLTRDTSTKYGFDSEWQSNTVTRYKNIVVSTIGSGSDVDIVTSWNTTTSDEKVPSEKLVKDSLDTKITKTSTDTGFLKSNGDVDSNTYSLSSHNHSGTYANASHNHNISDLNNTTTVAVTVTYTDNSTETINLLKYTGS